MRGKKNSYFEVAKEYDMFIEHLKIETLRLEFQVTKPMDKLYECSIVKELL